MGVGAAVHRVDAPDRMRENPDSIEQRLRMPERWTGRDHAGMSASPSRCDRLTPLDATFLELEEADPSAHMHIGSLMVFEALPAGPPSLESVARHIETRLGALPRYGCKLSEPHTGGLHWPAWVPDREFDIRAHMASVELPSPGGQRELLDCAACYWSERLDRERPLWDARLITGLADGRWAIATKTHHSLVDGVGAADVAHVLLDPTPRPRHAAPVGQPPELPRSQGPLDLLGGAVRGGLYAARHPGRLRDAFLQAKAIAETVVHDELIAAPGWSLNAPLSPRRGYRMVACDLEELKAIKGALGGTVNDVILAAVTGGLRAVAIERGEQIDAPGLRAMVPVNLRTAAEHFGLGNRVSSLFVHLPVMEPDPGHRYLLVTAETTGLKEGGRSEAMSEIVSLVGLAPPVLHSILARATFATRLFNVTVTNVPGPQLPLYAFGARMEEVWPLVPLAADHSIGVAIVSYDGKVFFGLNGDAGVEADLDVAAEGIATALAELSALATKGSALAALS
jgi:WS/DGAT/MGAT family acyltransferase